MEVAAITSSSYEGLSLLLLCDTFISGMKCDESPTSITMRRSQQAFGLAGSFSTHCLTSELAIAFLDVGLSTFLTTVTLIDQAACLTEDEGSGYYSVCMPRS
jgi:hypothetical protein